MSLRIKPSFVIALLLQHLVVIDGVRTVDMSEGSVARSSSSDALSSRVTVRETETPLVSIHFSIKPSEMQKMLGDRLVPDVYDGKAFIQVSMFYITTLEMQSFLGFVPSLMSSWCMRISAYVKMKDSGEKGYVILSADFESSISGKIMTSACGCLWPKNLLSLEFCMETTIRNPRRVGFVSYRWLQEFSAGNLVWHYRGEPDEDELRPVVHCEAGRE